MPEFLFITMTCFSRSLLRTVKCSSIHRLQLGFINFFIAPIGFNYFTALNFIYLHISIRDLVVLECSR